VILNIGHTIRIFFDLFARSDQDENIIEDTSIIEQRNFEKNKQRYAVFADEPKDLLQKNYLKYGRQ